MVQGKLLFYVQDYLFPAAGEIIKDEIVKNGWFHQHLGDTLSLDITLMNYLKKLNNKINDNKCRMYLSKLGLKK